MVDSGPDVPPECVDGERECDDDTLQVCVGGMWDRRPCALECRQSGATASCYDLVPSNLTRALSEVSATGTTVISDAYWNTDNCTTLPGYWYVESVSGAADLCVVAYENVRFESDMRVEGSRALVVVATGTITISAIIRADGEGTTPGPGGSLASYSGGNGGTRVAGGFASDGGGGGGGGYADGGSGGSAGGWGDSSTAEGGGGGASFGTSFEPLSGGGAGGVGNGPTAGAGGGGGGAIQFSARGDITYDGGMNVSGGSGRRGEIGSAGGGGGGGGTVHFESAGTIDFVSGVVLAAGAGGGGGGACSEGNRGREEEEGSISGGGRGGDCGGTRYSSPGAAGDDDGDGDDADNYGRPASNGGGGGGGSGLVVIRATSQTRPLVSSGHQISGAPVIAASAE